MLAAIVELEIALATMENNAPINEAAGKLEQAALERANAESYLKALEVLQSCVYVPDDACADECNRKYGDRYGVDWEYRGRTVMPTASLMRAKMKIESVVPVGDQEQLYLRAVYKDGAYPLDGLDEDNTFARFTPSAELSMTIANPALAGKFEVGQVFYVDFTPVNEAK